MVESHLGGLPNRAGSPSTPLQSRWSRIKLMVYARLFCPGLSHPAPILPDTNHHQTRE